MVSEEHYTEGRIDFWTICSAFVQKLYLGIPSVFPELLLIPRVPFGSTLPCKLQHPLHDVYLSEFAPQELCCIALYIGMKMKQLESSNITFSFFMFVFAELKVIVLLIAQITAQESTVFERRATAKSSPTKASTSSRTTATSTVIHHHSVSSGKIVGYVIGEFIFGSHSTHTRILMKNIYFWFSRCRRHSNIGSLVVLPLLFRILLQRQY